MTLSRFISTLRIASVAIGIVTITLNGAEAREAFKVVTVIDGFQSPESVLVVGDRRFVSNIGRVLDPLAKDGDGFISEISADGRTLAQRAFPPPVETLDSPKGMAALDGRLYVADIDRVVGFDLASGARVFEQRLPGDQPSLANDLAVTEEGHLLLTDTLRNALYRLDLKTGAFALVTDAIPGANGIVVDPRTKRILVVGLGENFSGGDVFSIDDTGRPSRLTYTLRGLFDGIALLPDGRLLVSDWKSIDLKQAVPGAFFVLSEGGAVSELQTERGIRGPADFALDAANRMLLIPSTLDNQVLGVQVNP